MNAFKGHVQMFLKDISLACLPGRFSADSSFLVFFRRLSIFRHSVTCCVHCAFLLQGAKYQSFVSLWRKLNKSLDYKEDTLQREVSHRPCGCSDNSLYHFSGLSAPVLITLLKLLQHSLSYCVCPMSILAMNLMFYFSFFWCW